MYNVVLEQFQHYYKSLKGEDLSLLQFREREFAFLQFDEQTMIRHMSFENEAEMKDYLTIRPPAHLYYSSAYYQNPQDSDMGRKGWIGADLIFDIDADHIPTECKKNHDTWKCLDCNEEGVGFPPEECPSCKKKRLSTNTWVCDECLLFAKKEIFKLIDDYLIPDFGLSEGKIEICFSGHRGYHLHVIDDRYKSLNNDGRREIADYVRGLGLKPDLHGFKVISKKDPLLMGPDIYNKGWRGRLAKSVYAYLSKCNSKELKKLYLPEENEDEEKYRERVLQKISGSPTWWGGLSEAQIKKFYVIALEAIKDMACNIDERVTIDTKRLIRYPNSLHGKSGLRACKISYNDLERFDPLGDAIAFKNGSIKVYVKDIPKIRIGDAEIGPIKEKDQQEIKVPMALGIYMICKGAAIPV
jgi:DNA primase small subunit